MEINFQDETIKKIISLGYNPDDIAWIGTSEECFSIDNFFNVINFNYNNGYGWNEIRSDLKIVFTDYSWLERSEYDGSEWWSYKSCPRMPDTMCENPTMKDLMDDYVYERDYKKKEEPCEL